MPLPPPSPENGYLREHAAILLASYRRWTGRALLDASLGAEAAARALFFAPFVAVSHNAETDPILTYGNQTALSLWEMDWAAFTATPSRKTAEPMIREERARLLAEAASQGYSENYRGVRISSAGRRFMIENALVWTLADARGQRVGQAATFSRWTFL